MPNTPDSELNRVLQTAAMMNGVFEKIFKPTQAQKWLEQAGEKIWKR